MKKSYLPLLLTLALAACQEEPLQPLGPELSSEMSFNLIAPGAQTKVTENTFEAEDKIGLYVTDWVDEDTQMPLQISGNRANNLALTYADDVWTPKKTIYWGEGKSDVYAYYPYIDEMTDINSQLFSVKEDQSTKAGYEASDLLWAVANGVSQKDGAVNLAMKHLMSKLTVRIVAGEDYVGSLPEDAEVLIHSTVTDARVDLETGAVVKDSYSGAKSIKMQNLGLKQSTGEEAVVYRAVVVPQMLQTTVPFLEINSKSVSYLLEDQFNFRPGVAYTYTITLNTSTNAIKVQIGCELEDWNSTGDDDEEEGEEGEGDGGEDDGLDYENLSAEGTANCYIVSQAGDYKFKAVQGNLDATVGNVKSVEVLWESFGTDEQPQVGDLIAAASYKNGYIRFSTAENFREGNAVIAAKNSAGVILWSWHIWMTDEPQMHFYNNKAGIMMDRNLGATSAEPGEVGTLGLFYQWGRKDPFLGSSSISKAVTAASTGEWREQSPTGNLQDWTEMNPTTYYDALSLSNRTWDSKKTYTDPCPVGWSVPVGKQNFWLEAGIEAAAFDDDYKGFWVYLSCPDIAWYPGTGLISDGTIKYTGAETLFWSVNEMGQSISIGLFSNRLSQNYEKNGAKSIRCYKPYDDSLVPEADEPEVSFEAATDLSQTGTSNCYIVSDAGAYSFTTVKGNGNQTVGSPVRAQVLWESFGTPQRPEDGDLIAAVHYENGKVYFKTADSFKEGNSLIAVKDEFGKILWSWHIWLTSQPQEQVYYNDAGTMMDRNLGAVGDNPAGLKYQWGRKDPFMGYFVDEHRQKVLMTYPYPSYTMSSDSQRGTIDYAVSYPYLKLSAGQGYDDWLYTESGELDPTRWQEEKTIYDPCPAGWRVPDGGPEGVWVKAAGYEDFTMYEEGTYSGVLGDDDIQYPIPMSQYSGNLNMDYWSITPNSGDTFSIYSLQIHDWGTLTGTSNTPNADEYIRCQKEE